MGDRALESEARGPLFTPAAPTTARKGNERQRDNYLVDQLMKYARWGAAAGTGQSVGIWVGSPLQEPILLFGHP